VSVLESHRISGSGLPNPRDKRTGRKVNQLFGLRKNDVRILYVSATLVPPPTDLKTDRFFLLSEQLEGDVLQPVWFRRPEEVEAVFGPGSYPVYTAGRFRYHWFLAWRHQGIWQRLAIFWFYLHKGMDLHREQRFDCILAYSHMTTGLCAGLLKLLRGGKLILEIVTAPELIYLTMRPNPSWLDRLMHFYSDLCLHLSMLLSDRFHLLYPQQVSKYLSFRKVPSSVFPDFVPVSTIDRSSGSKEREPYILLVGAPWYLKGADRIIMAFRGLAADFPHIKLKILGYYPDQSELNALAGGLPQIEILKARPNPEVLPIIREAMVLALPSRCEGVPRVLVEGMAAGIPLIGSDVGGIPSIVIDGENGYVISGGDSSMLEKRLRELLADPGKRGHMGNKGYVRAHTELDEKSYVTQFTEMVKATVHNTKH
jgi:glycosyltransferase involved in cell wall biosynthesis